jgi:hypothetical protein
MTIITGSALDLDAIRARAFDLRWLASEPGCIPMDDVTVRDADRAALAHILGADLPALITEVEQLRAKYVDVLKRATEHAHHRIALTAELDALRQSVADRAPTGGTR